MFAALLVAALACMPGPVSTSVPPTVAPPVEVQQTEAPVVTEAPTQPPASEYFTEEFDTDSGTWPQVVVENGDDPEADTSSAKVTIEDGRLAYDLGKFVIAYNIYDPYEYTDVRIDAHVENRGTNVNDILLLCRVSDEGHYLVNIANSGLYAMYSYEASKDVYRRIADGGSKKIKSGKAFNDYTLICKGRDLILYINGTKTRLFTENDLVLRSGKVGVGVASEDQLPVKVEFDSVKISEP
jgi:hypothetical protein